MMSTSAVNDFQDGGKVETVVSASALRFRALMLLFESSIERHA